MTFKTKRKVKAVIERPDFKKETQIDEEIPAEERDFAKEMEAEKPAIKSTVSEMAKEYLKVSAEISKIDAEYEKAMRPLADMKNHIKQSIKERLKEEGDLSRKFEFATVSLSVKKTLKVVDENKVISWLTAQKLDGEYVKPQLNDLFYDSFASSIEAEAKKVKEYTPPEGTIINETEFISVREVKKEGVERRRIFQDWKPKS